MSWLSSPAAQEDRNETLSRPRIEPAIFRVRVGRLTACSCLFVEQVGRGNEGSKEGRKEGTKKETKKERKKIVKEVEHHLFINYSCQAFGELPK